MSSQHRGPIAAVAAIALAGATLPGQQQFRSVVDLVRLPVTVTGKTGELVRGLTRGDFQVFEEGRPQEIAFFAEGTTAERLPVHLALLLDTSESMGQDLRAAADAAVRFVEAFDEAVDTTFVDFDTGVRVGQFSPSSYLRLFERIREKKKASGYTALYDAIGLYLQGALAREGQHVLLVHTDGTDTTSKLSYSKLERLLRLGNVIVYAVGYLENQPRETRFAGQSRLITIARETGGQAFFPSSPDQIHEIYAKILDELGSRYTIGYVSTNPVSDGKFRKVEVRLTRADLKTAKVRTRPGYLAPLAGGPR